MSNLQAQVNTNTQTIRATILNGSNINANITTYNAATIEKKGIIRIATDEEAVAGVSDSIAITPHTLKLCTNYIFEQAIASNTWIIEHNMNKYPSVTLTDSDGEIFFANIEYISANQIVVNLEAATTGYAYLN